MGRVKTRKNIKRRRKVQRGGKLKLGPEGFFNDRTNPTTADQMFLKLPKRRQLEILNSNKVYNIEEIVNEVAKSEPYAASQEIEGKKIKLAELKDAASPANLLAFSRSAVERHDEARRLGNERMELIDQINKLRPDSDTAQIEKDANDAKDAEDAMKLTEKFTLLLKFKDSELDEITGKNDSRTQILEGVDIEQNQELQKIFNDIENNRDFLKKFRERKKALGLPPLDGGAKKRRKTIKRKPKKNNQKKPKKTNKRKLKSKKR